MNMLNYRFLFNQFNSLINKIKFLNVRLRTYKEDDRYKILKKIEENEKKIKKLIKPTSK